MSTTMRRARGGGAIIAAALVWNQRLSTAKLNTWFAGIIEHHPPPAVSGRSVPGSRFSQSTSRPQVSAEV